MAVTKLQQTIGDIRRFREISGVLFDEGLSFVVDGLELTYLVPLRSRVKQAGRRRKEDFSMLGARLDPPVEVRVRRAFERLGPSFIKLGQILSMRPDIVPDNFVREFSKLQDQVTPLSPGVAEKVVEQALGQPIENIFESFDEKPLAAASLAVVHRARTKDGREVVVKVRRPGIKAVIVNDIHILAAMAKIIEDKSPSSRRFGPVKFVREFADWTMRELDFELEAANMDRFREMFADDPHVIIPEVDWDHVKRDVLVMSYQPGIKVDDLKSLDEAGVDREELAQIGLGAGIKMFLREGFFHADPHPGNMVAVPSSVHPFTGEPVPLRVALYDFGMTGNLSQKSRYELLSCFMSFVNKNVDGYAGHILDIAELGDEADPDGFVREAKRIVTDIVYKPNDRKGVALALYRVLLLGAKYDVRFPTDMILMGKAFFTLEEFGLKLCPQIDLAKVMSPFLKQMLRDELSPEKILKETQSAAFDRFYFLKHLPDQTRALFDRLEKGEIGVKLNLQELHDLKAEFDRQNDARILAVLTAALFLGSAAVMRLDEGFASAGLPLGEIGFVAALIMLIWVMVLTRRKPRI